MSPTDQPVPPISERTDDQLMAAINGGAVEESLAELRHRYWRRLFPMVQAIMRDRHLAEDVCEEVFAKVFFKSHLYEMNTRFSAWLFEIARNQALSTLRFRRRGPMPVSELEANQQGDDILRSLATEALDRSIEEQELMDALDDAIDRLPPNYRDVFTTCVQQGKQYQEAAREFGIPTGTVAIRIMRARKRLFSALSHHFDRIRRPPACFVN
ncbi:MAG: RNA polymerase sigma factor [Planctomycetota bacterium]